MEHGVQAAVKASWWVRVAAAWSWCLIAIVIVLGGVTWEISKVKVAIVPMVVAPLLALLLEPLNGRLQKWRFPNALSAAVSLIVGISALTVTIWMSASQLVSGAPAPVRKAGGGFGKLMTWLPDESLGLDSEDIDHYAKALSWQFGGLLEKYSSPIIFSAWSVTSSVLNLVVAISISVFCPFFLLKDGRRIWAQLMRLLPMPLREPAHEVGIRGWITLKGYIKVQAMAAGVDAVSISTGAAFLGADSMTTPPALLISLASFIPIVGVASTGTTAALVILLDQGLAKAITMLIVILAVQQIEPNVLQPLSMSNATNIHLLVVLLAVTVGGYFASIIGALLVVPIVAFLNAVVLHLTGHDTMPQLVDQHNRVDGASGTIHAQIQAPYK